MDSSAALKYHLRTFHLAGVWPNASKYSFQYNTWTLFVFLVLGILFPLSQILNIFFADSIIEMVDRSVITSSVVVVVIKALNLYIKRKELDAFFTEMKKLDVEIQEESQIQEISTAIKIGHKIFFSYLYPYISTCVLLVFQTIFSRPAIRMWSSTYAYPSDWAQKTKVYVIGLFIQGICNTCIVIFAVAADTYGAVLIHMLSTHIDILQARLKELGKNKNKSDKDYEQLIFSCKAYESILRCSKLLENALGPALFAQFGVSGVVLCTSAYQLTVIAPSDVSKLSFVIVYFMCMLTEVFVPCYFGSVALEKSKLMGWKIYESNWINQDKKYKQAFRILVERTIKPIHLVAYKVFLLNLSTFLQILKTAYSLFALLKSV